MNKSKIHSIIKQKWIEIGEDKMDFIFVDIDMPYKIVTYDKRNVMITRLYQKSSVRMVVPYYNLFENYYISTLHRQYWYSLFFKISISDKDENHMRQMYNIYLKDDIIHYVDTIKLFDELKQKMNISDLDIEVRDEVGVLKNYQKKYLLTPSCMISRISADVLRKQKIDDFLGKIN